MSAAQAQERTALGPLTGLRAPVQQVSANSGRSDADSEALEERELLALEEVMDHSDVHVRSLVAAFRQAKAACGAAVVDGTAISQVAARSLSNVHASPACQAQQLAMHLHLLKRWTMP